VRTPFDDERYGDKKQDRKQPTADTGTLKREYKKIKSDYI